MPRAPPRHCSDFPDLAGVLTGHFRKSWVHNAFEIPCPLSYAKIGGELATRFAARGLDKKTMHSTTITCLSCCTLTEPVRLDFFFFRQTTCCCCFARKLSRVLVLAGDLAAQMNQNLTGGQLLRFLFRSACAARRLARVNPCLRNFCALQVHQRLQGTVNPMPSDGTTNANMYCQLAGTTCSMSNQYVWK